MDDTDIKSGKEEDILIAILYFLDCAKIDAIEIVCLFRKWVFQSCLNS